MSAYPATLIGALLLILVNTNCQAPSELASARARAAISRYYGSVENTDFDQIKAYSESRMPLLPLGATVQRLLIADLRSERQPPEIKVKAMFAMAAFREKGQPACEAQLLPTLIELLDDDSEHVRQWAALLLQTLTNENLDTDKTRWLAWWREHGSKGGFASCDTD